MNEYRRPMQPWPTLAQYARAVALPGGPTLHVYDCGPAPAGDVPFLLVHGLGDEADTWRHVFAPLAQRRRVVAPDLPGFGRSDPLRGRPTLDALTSILLHLMDALDIPRAVLIGHSLGAMIAQAIALHHPARAAGLILGDGTLLIRKQPGGRTLFYLLPGLGEWLYTRLRRDPQEAYATLRPYCADFDALPQADRDFLFQRVNERVWSDKQRAAFLGTVRGLTGLTRMQSRLPVELEACKVPTLVIWGDQDRIADVENGRAMVELQPGAALAIIPGAGHMPHQEQPEAFLEAVGKLGVAPA